MVNKIFLMTLKLTNSIILIHLNNLMNENISQNPSLIKIIYNMDLETYDWAMNFYNHTF